MGTRLTAKSQSPFYKALVTLLVALGLFAIAVLVSRVIVRSMTVLFDVGAVGTHSRLVVSVAGLQLFGFGIVLVSYLLYRPLDWRSYLRVDSLTEWTVFYGAAVGLGLMLVTVGATGLFTLLNIDAAESQVGQATDPSFYLLLFVLSTFVAVPMEELFFRGLLQRRLEETLHPGFAIGVASILFMIVHTGVNVGSGGAVITYLMFFTFGVVLGASYYLTENLLVPIIGHLIFNGVQILIRGFELLL